MADLNLAVRIAGEDAGATALIKKVDTGLGGLGGVAKTAGLAVAGVGLAAAAAAAGGLAASVNAAADFEQKMSAVKAVSGATASEMQQLSGLALQLGKDTSFSAGEAASGLEELVKGGLTIPQIMDGAAKSTLALAAAGGVSLPDAAEIAANALAIFNLEGKDMAMVSDQIAGAANASSLSVGDFKMALAAGGSVMAAAGQDFDQVATAIALMGAEGIKSSDAGTSLKTMFNNLIPTTKGAKKAMEEVGLWTKEAGSAFVNADGSIKDVSEISGILTDTLGHLTEAQRLTTAEAIFGTDGMRAALVMTNAGSEGYANMAEKMGKVTAESVAAEKINTNFRGSMDQLTGSLETAGITLGLAFLPLLKQLTDGATGVVNAMIPFLKVAGEELVKQVGKGIDFLQSIDLSPFFFLWEHAQDIMADFAEVVQQALSGDVTGAIGGLLDVVTDTRGRLVELLAGWGQSFVEWLLPMVPILLDYLAQFSQEIAGKIAQFAAEYVEQLATWGAAFVDWIAPKIPDLLRELGNFSAKMLGWLIGDALPAIIGKLGEWGLAFIEWVAPRIPPLLVELGKLLAQLTGWVITTALPAIIGKLVEWGLAFVDWVADVVLPKLPGALAAIRDSINAWIAGAVSGITSEMAKIGNAMIDGIRSGIAAKWEGLKSWLMGLVGGLPAAAASAITARSPSRDFAEQVGEPIPLGIMEGIDATWGNLETHLQGKLSDLVEWTSEALADANADWHELVSRFLGSGGGGGSGGSGGGSSEGPNADGQSAPSQFQSDPLYQQISQNKQHGNVPGRLSMDFGNGISYNAEADTYRGADKPHPGKSGYYSVWYRINSLLSAGHFNNVKDAFGAAVKWVLDRTDDRYDAQLGWTLGAGAGAGAGNVGAMSLEQLNSAWAAAGFPSSGPIWDEIVRRRPTGYGGGMARGGAVRAGMAYTVGERGPETLVMGGASGRILPHGSGIDYERLAVALAQQPITVTLNGEAVGRLVRDELARLSRRNGGLGLAPS